MPVHGGARKTNPGVPEHEQEIRMQTTRTIRSLMLVTSLAAGAMLVASSQNAFAGCAPRDHRTNCDSTPRVASPQNQNPNAPVVSPTVRQNGRIIYYNNPYERVVIGSQPDGKPVYSSYHIGEKIYQRFNKDGSVDRVQEIRQNGNVTTRVLDHTPPNPPKANLCGGSLFGVCW